MLELDVEVVMWLLIWSFIGSTLGFFAIHNKDTWELNKKIRQYLLFVAIGMFFAFPIYTSLYMFYAFSEELSIMCAGGTAFVTADIMTKEWPRYLNKLDDAIDKIIDKIIGKL